MAESPFRSIGNKVRLVDQVVEEIQRLIILGRLEPGTKLPAERELAERIGVSRTVVREAVHVLVTKGLLTTKHGVGTIVRQTSPENITESINWLLRTHNISLDDLHQVRSILEVENVRQATLQATREDIAQLKRILEEMGQAVGEAETFADKDAEFHSALAGMTHNPLLLVLLDSISDLIREVRLSVSGYPHLFSTVMPDHRRILERVEARDVEGACQAMLLHLEHARQIQELLLTSRERERLSQQKAQAGREQPPQPPQSPAMDEPR